MKIYEEDKKIIIKEINNFDLDQIFESGQEFRWVKENDGSYTGIVKDKILNLSQDGSTVYFNNTTLKDFQNIWYDYFGFDIDYKYIKETLSNIDDKMKTVIEHSGNQRILNQDKWETLIAFILSTNNSIQMVEKVMNNLSIKYGEYIDDFNGRQYYSFPSPEKLASLSLEELRNCKMGFRDKYVKAASQAIVSGEINLDNIANLNTTECIEELKNINGIGTKVADCIAMFSMKKSDVFPVDIWMKRIMEEFYIDSNMSVPKIREFAINKFGDLSVYAQQYLFNYARKHQIGK